MSLGENSSRGKLSTVFAHPVTIKIVAIGILTLLLLLPASMIESLIRERANRQNEAVEGINSKWGHEQTVVGPFISVPYAAANGGKVCVHILPETLIINGRLAPKLRYRGIFEAVLYDAKLELTGSFSLPEDTQAGPDSSNLDWSSARLAVGLSDMRGIRDRITVKFGDKDIALNPGMENEDLVSSGVSAPVPIEPGRKEYPFRLVVDLTGSERISFAPVGKTTNINLASNWTDPSFCGAYLPYERSMSDKGFSASWKVMDLNRDYPQHWEGRKYAKQVQHSSIGVGLFTPVDFYQKSMRMTKYAILFVALIFVAFFIAEMLSDVRLHPIQYLLIGLAIMAFYTLLLSLSEHVGFGTAYLIASSAVIALVTTYAASILGRGKLALIVGAVLVLVYGYSYWLIQLVDYALLAGSVGLFIVLSAIMFATRKIDWYSIGDWSNTGQQSSERQDCPDLDEDVVFLDE